MLVGRIGLNFPWPQQVHGGQVLGDLAVSDTRWRVALPRYIPVSTHEIGQIGEDPLGIPNNLLPYITRVAVGKLPDLAVFGNNYPTAPVCATTSTLWIWPKAT